jgi:hypothetical protein
LLLWAVLRQLEVLLALVELQRIRAVLRAPEETLQPEASRRQRVA